MRCWRPKEGIFIELNGFFYSDDVFGEMGVENNFGPLEIESPNLQPSNWSHTHRECQPHERLPRSGTDRVVAPKFPDLVRI